MFRGGGGWGALGACWVASVLGACGVGVLRFRFQGLRLF